jgi:hypothetical protein
LYGKRSGDGFAPDPGFSRRSRALLLGGEELASRPSILRTFAGKLRQLRRPASSEPAALEGGPGKAKPSMVASAISGSFPFSTDAKEGKKAVFDNLRFLI